MFTVKHIEADGSERMFEVLSVERKTDGRLIFLQEKVVKTGRVFIMNDNGKTVGTYDFDKEAERK